MPFTTFSGKDAAGLKGPFSDRGVLIVVDEDPRAAAASRSRPRCLGIEPAMVKRGKVWVDAVPAVRVVECVCDDLVSMVTACTLKYAPWGGGVPPL